MRPGRSDEADGDGGALLFTKLSELPVIEFNDCGAYEELIVSASGFGGGGVGDLRAIGDTGRDDGFGDAGRIVGVDFAGDMDFDVDGAGAGVFNGGGGIIPLLWSTLVAIGRDMDISGPSLIGAGARRLITFGTPGLDFSRTEKNGILIEAIVI